MLNFQNLYKTYGYTVIYSLAGYLGINVVLQLVKHFGALMAVTGKRKNKRDFKS